MRHTHTHEWYNRSGAGGETYLTAPFCKAPHHRFLGCHVGHALGRRHGIGLRLSSRSDANLCTDWRLHHPALDDLTSRCSSGNSSESSPYHKSCFLSKGSGLSCNPCLLAHLSFHFAPFSTFFSISPVFTFLKSSPFQLTFLLWARQDFF